jgi:hypothetical protein
MHRKLFRDTLCEILTSAEASASGRPLRKLPQTTPLRKVEGRLDVARKPRLHDEWDPPIEPYDPYGPRPA